ncbi:MAG: DUF2029 domain-containing protein [Chloroflexi bacterium]|nr:DUF2029 domain-containing protein [Chloroflexota bacterium]
MGVKRRDLAYLGLIIICLLLFTGLTWVNYQFTTINSGGNDFTPRWLGTRLFITEGLSPYSQNTTDEIQDFFYGRTARGEEDRALFVYPHYSMLVFAPFSLVEDYPQARALWMAVLETSILIISFISLSLTRWRPSLVVFGVYILFNLSWYHAVRPIINGNAAVVVALFISMAFLAIRAGQDMYAGAMLALASIKPQMVILLIPFVIYWAYSKGRWRLLGSIIGGLLILVIVSLLIERDWIIQNLRQVINYPEYSPPGSTGAIFSVWWPETGRQLSWALNGVLVILLIREWLAVYGKSFHWFLWSASLTLVVTNLIGITTATANYIALIPALTLVLSVWEKRWGRSGGWFVIGVMLVFLVGLWVLFLNTVRPGMGVQPVQGPIMFFPLPIFLLFSLYWIRLWVLQPRHLGIEDILSAGEI